MTKTEREWEVVRATGVGAGIVSAAAASDASSGPSLYDQLKAKEEQSANEEDERRGHGLPQALDEDGTRQTTLFFPLPFSHPNLPFTNSNPLLYVFPITEARFFDEQKMREREEERRMERQVDNFKKAAALASATHKSEPAILSLIKPKSDAPTITKKIAPIAKIVAVKPVSSSSSTSASEKTLTVSDVKKRTSEIIEEEAPQAKRAKLDQEKVDNAQQTTVSTPKIPLVRYRRDDD